MPFPEPNRDVDAPRCPTARCSLPLLGSPCLFDADYAGIQAPRISNKPAVHRLFSPLLFSSLLSSSPPLACFCDVCAAQILSELELGNNLAARSPNSMISRSLNDRCANCSITSLTCYNAATQPIASNLNTWTRLWIRSIQHPSPLQRRIKTTNQPNLHQNPFNQGLLNVQE